MQKAEKAKTGNGGEERKVICVKKNGCIHGQRISKKYENVQSLDRKAGCYMIEQIIGIQQGTD